MSINMTGTSPLLGAYRPLSPFRQFVLLTTRRNLLSLAILVMLFFNMARCDWDTPWSGSDSSIIQNGRNHSRRNFRNSHDSSGTQRTANFDERQWQTARRETKRNKKNGRNHRLSQIQSDKSNNEILRPQNFAHLSHDYEPNFASSSQFPTYANQSVFSKSFVPNSRATSTSRAGLHSSKHHNRIHSEDTKKRPNIIFMLTDDQDIELGSMNYMPKAMKILSEGGVHVKNAYVTTPMCCPSRSSILTGLYVHNHNVYTNGENCSSTQWQQTHERRTYATYLRESGYRTAFFGKYLNEYNGTYIPPGWSDWSALVRNSRYYNYTLNVNGDRVRHGANYELDYYPDLILNDSLQYMRYSKRFFSKKPYLMVLSFPSPHGPEDAAPQYQDMFLNEKAHRTPSWNSAPNADKQWILRHTHRMAPLHQHFTDFLNAKRLQTLQSIDEAVHQIYTELKNLGELDNTYIVYTSDHGYHLGQFGLVKGKAMPFEFDIRVPFYVRGPSIPRNKVLSQIVLNIDIAPTLIDIAGLKVPPHMDGVSFLPYLKQLNSTIKVKAESKSHSKTKPRDSFLIEKGKFKMPHEGIDGLLIPIIGKKQWLQLECQKPEYQSPCKLFQKFECFQDDNGTYRIRKCHRANRGGRLRQKLMRDKCICVDSSGQEQTVSTRELDNNVVGRYDFTEHPHHRHRRKHKNRHATDRRKKRSEETSLDSDPNGFDVAGVYKLKKFIDLAKTSSSPGLFDLSNAENKANHINSNSISNITTNQLVSILGPEAFSDLSNYTDYLNKTFCTVARTNLSIECSEEIYRDQGSWKEKKQYIDTAITHLQRRLFELRGIRRFMNDKRPKNNSQDSDFCQCNGDQESLMEPQYESVSRHHPRRLGERHYKKHMQRKKWINKHEKKQRRKEKFENTTCEEAASEQMNCFTHDNDHWKTPPFWTNGPFCFCQNSLNNSFWCLRTINATHNLLYCEFVTGFITYFDLNKDPFQFRNAIYDLEMSTVERLSAKLAQLKSCAGSAQCSNLRPNVRRTDNPTKKGSMDYNSNGGGGHHGSTRQLQHFWRHASHV